MTLPICIEIPPLAEPMKLSLPGGVTLERINLLEIVQPALSPLMPLFNIIDALMALFECVKAIPEALGPPPDPKKLVECMPEVAKKVSALLRLLPQMSLPYLVKDVIDLILDTLKQVRGQLVQLQEQMQEITHATTRASELGDARLMAIIACAQANVAQEAANLGKMLASLGKLIALLNVFLGMLGLPEAPDLSKLSGLPLDKVLEPIDALIKVFEAVKKAVPLP